MQTGMHVVRSLLPQFLESLGYSVRQPAPDSVGGLTLLAERDGHTFGVVYKDGAVSGADAVELRLVALANDVIPLVVAPDGLAGDGARWVERFGIQVLGPMEVFAFEAAVEAEEALVAEERLWALDHALPAVTLPPPLALPSEVPVEIHVGLPDLAVVVDPYALDDLVILRRSDLIETVRHRTELAAEALTALPFPPAAFVEHPVWSPLLDWAPAAALALPFPPAAFVEHAPWVAFADWQPEAALPLVPPALAPEAFVVPAFDPYTLDGLWAEAASERLLAEAQATEVAAETLAALPFPVVAEPAPIPLIAEISTIADERLAVAEPALAAPGVPEPPAPPVDPLPWQTEPAEAAAPLVAAEPMPWAAEATLAPAAAEPSVAPPEPVAARLPWEAPAVVEAAASADSAAEVPEIDARLPWNAAEPQPEPAVAEDPRAALLRQHREASLATNALGRMLPSPSQDNLVARADPSLWGTRGRLDEIRQRLNARNVALSVEGVESEWLRAIGEDASGNE